MDTKNKGFNTKLVHGGDYEDAFGSAIMPIYQTSTFAFEDAQQGADRFAGKIPGYIYTRMGNPTVNALEEKIAQLENGYRSIAVASGMAAVTTVYMALLSQGAHIITTDAMYGPSRSVLVRDFSRFGVEADFVDTSKLENIKKAIKPNTKLIYI